ncbi:NAD-dependent epimerase/dehydratase family protein [Thalassococcus lentus]|uniref:NAD(P)-dependent oxidoreductase n=1 Tax=Thalassococcus lentus TaxID=1210524 RepID=A0ABT4XWP0_9RHOB|nr:NAD(P)-dependent oxidoreductase [Thalassococcus lentus]MDA7426374.1 NAD(P)-dependent oxidoreductase [Thalassococcus lentus]
MLKKLLITGANGTLGRLCRERMHPFAETLRISDLGDLGDAAPHEELVACDLGDKAGVEALVEGCDGIIHLGGQSTEGTWDAVRHANIEGVANLYEAARKSSAPPRIIFASSNHAIGFYKQDENLDAHATTRPDSLYGVSKVFGEAMASLYHDKFGIETASIRIGSCFPEPIDHRMLATWLSFDDFIRLIERIFIVPRLGCPIIYGASNNVGTWWDNTAVQYIGWTPQDSSEGFRAKLDAAMERPDKNDPRALYQGGTFCSDGIHE